MLAALSHYAMLAYLRVVLGNLEEKNSGYAGLAVGQRLQQLWNKSDPVPHGHITFVAFDTQVTRPFSVYLLGLALVAYDTAVTYIYLQYPAIWYQMREGRYRCFISHSSDYEHI